MNFLTKYFASTKSLTSLETLSKNDKEYEQLFLDKFYKEYSDIKHLLETDYYGFQKYVKENFSSYSKESLINHFIKLEKDKIFIKHSEVLLSKHELKEQTSNRFLSDFKINIIPFLCGQRDYALSKFNKKPKKSIEYLQNVVHRLSYFDLGDVYSVEMILKIKEYGNEVYNMSNDHDKQMRILDLYCFNDMLRKYHYSLYESVNNTSNISERKSWEILDNHKDISLNLFHGCLSNIKIEKKSEAEKLFKILSESKHKDEYKSVLKEVGSKLNEIYDKELSSLVNSLKNCKIKTSSRRTSSRGSSEFDVVGAATDVAVGAFIGSMFD